MFVAGKTMQTGLAPKARWATSWYEPVATDEDLDRGIHFALSTANVHAFCTPDIALLKFSARRISPIPHEDTHTRPHGSRSSVGNGIIERDDARDLPLCVHPAKAPTPEEGPSTFQEFPGAAEMSMVDVDLTGATESDVEPVVVTIPAVGIAEPLAALEHCGRVDVDKFGC
jgi:hypothetical protein